MFKKDAVDLVLTSGRTPTEVARELGVSAEGLRSWVKQAKTDRGQGPVLQPWVSVEWVTRCSVHGGGACGAGVVGLV
ncbi:transposase, partial [Streptomyces cinereoruber]|uniref:transposase n=1 Tax=Streptomyces cinereoruber TaxID=67260 RepID=UPI0036603489